MEAIAEPPLGYLELILGPMWSGKTSRLLDLHKQYSICGIPTMLINYVGDTERGVPHASIVSHDGRKASCRTVSRLGEIAGEEIADVRVLLVNEAQFFPDAVSWIQRAVDVLGKRVHAAGLDGDYMRRPFGAWLDLIPLADAISKLRAFCRGCRVREALFSNRTTESKQVELIGAADIYEPLCRRCYLSAQNTKVLEED